MNYRSIILGLLFLCGCNMSLQQTHETFTEVAKGTVPRVVESVKAPVAENITAPNTAEDSTTTLILSYSHPQSLPATSCEISQQQNLVISRACACVSGVCSVGVKGAPQYSGPASFNYKVFASGVPSNSASVSMTFDFVDDAPVAGNMNAASINENIQTMFTLSYIDEEGDLATSCSVSNLMNITVTQPCACVSGTCNVGITGNLNYSGPATFNYAVIANGKTSNSALVNFTVLDTSHPPVASNVTAPSFNEDTQSIINLSYTDADGDLAATCAVSSPVNVTVTRACACALGVCTVGVTGTTNYYGTGSFTYSVTANGETSNSSTATLTINAVDDVPVAISITPPSFNEDTQSIIALSYIDTESDSATSCAVSVLSNVTVTQPCSCTSGICTVGVTGTNNYYGAASFSYTVTANGKISGAAGATLTINPVNDAPVVGAISPASFNKNTESIITLPYTDVENDLASSCALTALSNITETSACACASGICTVGVTGTNNYYGSASFNFTVTAGTTSNIGTASLTIVNTNSPAVANNITPAAFNEDVQSIITLSYSDTDGDLATGCTLSNLTNMNITQACNCTSGVCTVGVTGALDYFGSASFNYRVITNTQNSNSATATLSINAVDDNPVAMSLTPPSFNEDTQSIISLSYTDTESDPATACAISVLSNVTVTQPCSCTSGICSVGVTGTNNYYGAASFSYTVTANGKISGAAGATLTINPVNDAPVVGAISPASFNKNTESIITLPYTDVENDLASSCALTALSNITETSACACASGICTVGVTGTNNYYGSASFNFTVTAGTTSNTGTAALTIVNTNSPAVASNITPAAFNEDVQSLITLNYTDIDGDLATSCTLSNLTNINITQPCSCTSGVCTVGVTGSLDYFGSASFNYQVITNTQNSNSATATLTITPVNDPPVTSALSPLAFSEDTESIITLPYVDAENDQGTTCSVTGLTNVTTTTACACAAGICTVGVTGTLNYYGSAAFTYTVTANGQTSSPSTATLTITPDNDAPVAANITPPSFNEDVASIITLSYTDTESDEASACVVSDLTNITVTQSCACTSGVCTVGVIGSPNYYGTGSFTYTVTANSQTSSAATASFTMNAVDDTPVASDITPAAFNEDTQSIVTLSYTDVESDAATTCSVSGLSNISVTQSCACSSGTCTVGVTGQTNYSGSAGFTYEVVANGKTSNSATATLVINAADDAPVAINLTPGAFDEDTISTINLVYTDAEFDSASSCALTNLVNVSVTSACSCVLGSCSVSVRGTQDYYGTASFSYTVTTNALTSAPAVASLTVSPVDDAPVANNTTAPSFNEDTQSIVTLSYTDVENHQATSCSASNLINLTETQACTCVAGICTVGVTGTSNSTGAVSFNFTVTANGLSSNAGLVSSTLNPVDDAPVASNITPPAFDENVQSIITLNYYDADSDQASSCAVSSLSNVTVTQSCACASGVCTVGVTGLTNYNGAASFNYTVTANAITSNSATATLSINSVNSLPVMSAIGSASTFLNTPSGAISFTITDPDNTLTCSSGSLSMSSSNTAVISNSAVTWGGTAPNCTAVITPTTNKHGPLTLTFTVSDGSGGTDSKSFSFTVTNGTIALQWRKVDGTVINSFDYGDPAANTSITLQLHNTGTGVTGTMNVTVSGNSNLTAIPLTHDCTNIGPASYCTVTHYWKESGGGTAGVKTGTATGSDGTYSAALTITGIN